MECWSCIVLDGHCRLVLSLSLSRHVSPSRACQGPANGVSVLHKVLRTWWLCMYLSDHPARLYIRCWVVNVQYPGSPLQHHPCSPSRSPSPLSASEHSPPRCLRPMRCQPMPPPTTWRHATTARSAIPRASIYRQTAAARRTTMVSLPVFCTHAVYWCNPGYYCKIRGLGFSRYAFCGKY